MNSDLHINGTGLFGVDYQLTNTVNSFAIYIFYTSNLTRKNNSTIQQEIIICLLHIIYYKHQMLRDRG